MPFKKIATSEKPKLAKFVGSPQQEAIWEEVVSSDAHLIVNALAGTGKTTVLVQGIFRLPKNERKLTAILAFNKPVAVHFQSLIPPESKGCTSHSLGNSAISRSGLRPELDHDKVSELTESLLGWRPGRDQIAVAKRLVSLCKANLLDGKDEQLLLDAMNDYGIASSSRTDEIVDLIPDLLEACQEDTTRIDYDDMLWFPVVNPVVRSNIEHYSTLMVDEAQDLNRCQQKLALLAGERLILCGDKNQSIYGFRGADPESIPRMYETLSSTDRGCIELPLTVTRRCPQSVVRLAQNLVPDFEALPDAPEGSVDQCNSDELQTRLSESVDIKSDLILCRINAPLLSCAYKLIRNDIRATVAGRDIGRNILSLIRRLKPSTPTDLAAKLSRYYFTERDKLNATKYPSESKLAALTDRCDCVSAISEGCDSISEIETRINTLFSDSDSPRVGVLLSSVHKAKGLEAERVFILEPSKLPHPMAKLEWDKQQERNIAYVAVTRSARELYFVGGQSKFFPLD